MGIWLARVDATEAEGFRRAGAAGERAKVLGRCRMSAGSPLEASRRPPTSCHFQAAPRAAISDAALAAQPRLSPSIIGLCEWWLQWMTMGGMGEFRVEATLIDA